EQMQEQLNELESVATSPDGSVRVVAGPGGAVKDIKLSQEALRQQAGALSATIMSTLQRAVAGAARKQAELVEAHMGGMGAGITEQVLEAQAEAFGVSVEELKGEGEQADTAPAANEMRFDQPIDEPAPEPQPRRQTPPRPASPPQAGPYGAPGPQQRPAGPPPQRPTSRPQRRGVDFDDDDEGLGSGFERCFPGAGRHRRPRGEVVTASLPGGTSVGNGYNVDIPALKTYANNLSFYTSEADKFGTLIDQAEVPEKAWGLVGLFAKQTYSEKLKELEDLLGQMK